MKDAEFPTRFVIADLETVRDRSLPEPKRPEECAPPPWHEIVCLGWMQLDLGDPKATICGTILGDEKNILRVFTNGFAKNPGTTLVTFSGRRFDVPAIVARCMKHGIAWPWWWKRHGARVRYRLDGHIDLCDELSDYGASTMVGLDVWAKLCGLPGKSGHGADVDKMHAEGRIQEIADYCLGDVRMTAGVLLRWLVTRGAITVDEEGPHRKAVLEAMPKARQAAKAA